MMLYKFIRPIIFLLEAERAHNAATSLGVFLGRYRLINYILRKIYCIKDDRLKCTHFGRIFENPVGLSAGFDYEGRLSAILPFIGFGFQSVGTATYKANPGNPKPRLGRLPKSKSILVNKGLRSSGTRNVINQVRFTKNYQIGISLGQTNSVELATPDVQLIDVLNNIKEVKDNEDFAYIELNISCPNSHGGESFVDEVMLEKLLFEAGKIRLKRPLAVKFPIEIQWEKARRLIKIMIDYKVEAIIIGNLAKDRSNLAFNKQEVSSAGKGNFSGAPTRELSNNLIKLTYQEFGNRITIIGVGGIMSAEDAYQKIKLGASMVQLITGIVYEGPGLVKKINKGLLELLEKDGYNHISEAIGAGVRAPRVLG